LVITAAGLLGVQVPDALEAYGLYFVQHVQDQVGAAVADTEQGALEGPEQQKQQCWLVDRRHTPVCRCAAAVQGLVWACMWGWVPYALM
jgi:hypothetical protein